MRNKNKSTLIVTDAIVNALQLIDNELALHKENSEAVGSPQQLQELRRHFRDLLVHIEDGNISFGYNRIGKAIVDSWPYDAPIAEAVLKAENGFLALAGD